MATHTFATKLSPVSLLSLDEALAEAAKSLPYYPLAIRTETSTPYVLVLADGLPNAVLRMNLAGDCQVTIPPHSSVALPLGTRIAVDQWGEGQIHFVGGLGVEIRRALSAWSRRQYSRVWLEKLDQNGWLIYGDLEPIFDSPG